MGINTNRKDDDQGHQKQTNKTLIKIDTYILYNKISVL